MGRHIYIYDDAGHVVGTYVTDNPVASKAKIVALRWSATPPSCAGWWWLKDDAVSLRWVTPEEAADPQRWRNGCRFAGPVHEPTEGE